MGVNTLQIALCHTSILSVYLVIRGDTLAAQGAIVILCPVYVLAVPVVAEAGEERSAWRARWYHVSLLYHFALDAECGRGHRTEAAFLASGTMSVVLSTRPNLVDIARGQEELIELLDSCDFK